MKYLAAFLLLHVCLFAKNRVELVHNFTADPSNQALFEQGKTSPWFRLREFLGDQGYALFSSNAASLKNDNELSHVVFWNMPGNAKKTFASLPKNKLILFIWEPPSVQMSLYKKKTHDRFKKVYTWDDDLVDNKKFFKFFYPVLHPMKKNLPAFEERKLCTTILTNKTSTHPTELYSERKRMIQFFEDLEEEDFDFYGYGWESGVYKNYRGPVQNKHKILKNYRFTFCYENMHSIKGYISEKIFDAFACGSIPIYLGASNIDQFIPNNCFIDRRKFSSDQAVYDYMKNMLEEEYETYLTNIRHFLKSDTAKLFSADHFIKTFFESLK